MSIVDFIKKFLNTGNKRSVAAKKNITASFFIKGTDILIGFLLIPMLLHYFGEMKYGIWLTMTSLVTWFSFFDVGLGGGLRNRLAESYARGSRKDAKVYISTTYAIITIIIAIVLSLFLILNYWIPWPKILNTTEESMGELRLFAYIVVTAYSLNFITNLVHSVLLADQKPAVCSLITLIGKILIIIAVFFVSRTDTNSFILMSFAVALPPVFVLFFANLYFFSKDYREYRPSLKSVKFSYAKDLMSLGFKFLILQMGAMVLHSTDNVIISQLFSPEEVTPYRISYKYFSIFILAFRIVMQPFWSAMTDAYARGELMWIKKTVRVLLMIATGFMLLLFVQLLVSPIAYRLWLGDEINIPMSLSFFMMLVFSIRLYNSIFTTFLNGVGKVNLSMASAIFNILFNIPLSIYFAKYLGLGVEGVILATGVTALFNLILRPLQYHKIINNKATGIWNK